MTREFVVCNLCHNNASRHLYIKRYSGERYQIVKCKSCGLVYMNPRLREEKNKELYDEKYYYFNKTEDSLNITKAINNFKILKKYNKTKGSLLDVGCGKGFFLKIAKDNGWEVHGIDISDYAREFAKKQFNLNVSLGDLENIEFSEKKFDVITLWDTLEHLRRPYEVLEKIKKLLKKEGRLFIKTPNINSIFYKLYRRYWLGFNPFHLYYFSPKTLREILQQSGFRIVKLETLIASLFSKEGLWDRGLKTPMAEILDSLKLKEKIKKKFTKRKFTNTEEIDLKQVKFSNLILPRNKLIDLLNCPLEHLINKLKMGDYLLMLAKKLS